MLKGYGFSLNEIWGMTLSQVSLYLEAIAKEKNDKSKRMAIMVRSAQASKSNFSKLIKELDS